MGMAHLSVSHRSLQGGWHLRVGYVLRMLSKLFFTKYSTLPHAAAALLWGDRNVSGQAHEHSIERSARQFLALPLPKPAAASVARMHKRIENRCIQCQ